MLGRPRLESVRSTGVACAHVCRLVGAGARSNEPAVAASVEEYRGTFSSSVLVNVRTGQPPVPVVDLGTLEQEVTVVDIVMFFVYTGSKKNVCTDSKNIYGSSRSP